MSAERREKHIFMARNFKSFGKETERLFSPMARSHGFEFAGECLFTRTRGDVVQGLHFQLTRHGDSTFACNVGIHVPALAALMGRDSSFAPYMSSRLSETGVGGQDCWLSAASKEALEDSLGQYSAFLPLAEPWLERFSTIKAIADDATGTYAVIMPEGPRRKVEQYRASEHGMLLFLAGDMEAARQWLTAALGLLKSPDYVMKGRKEVAEPPSPDELEEAARVEALLDRMGGTSAP